MRDSSLASLVCACKYDTSKEVGLRQGGLYHGCIRRRCAREKIADAEYVEVIPLEKMDVWFRYFNKSDPSRPWFARLRREASLHVLAENQRAPLWSVTILETIVDVDTNQVNFSLKWAALELSTRGLLQKREILLRSFPVQVHPY